MIIVHQIKKIGLVLPLLFILGFCVSWVFTSLDCAIIGTVSFYVSLPCCIRKFIFFLYSSSASALTECLIKLYVRRGCNRDVSFRNDFSPALSASRLMVDLWVNHLLLEKEASMSRLREASIYVYKFAKKIIFLKNWFNIKSIAFYAIELFSVWNLLLY